MPHNGLRFPERSRARLSKKSEVAKSAKPKLVSTSVIDESEEKKTVTTTASTDTNITEITSTNVKKEEPTPENNDVKTDSKE